MSPGQDRRRCGASGREKERRTGTKHQSVCHNITTTRFGLAGWRQGLVLRAPATTNSRNLLFISDFSQQGFLVNVILPPVGNGGPGCAGVPCCPCRQSRTSMRVCGRRCLSAHRVVAPHTALRGARGCRMTARCRCRTRPPGLAPLLLHPPFLPFIRCAAIANGLAVCGHWSNSGMVPPCPVGAGAQIMWVPVPPPFISCCGDATLLCAVFADPACWHPGFRVTTPDA